MDDPSPVDKKRKLGGDEQVSNDVPIEEGEDEEELEDEDKPHQIFATEFILKEIFKSLSVRELLKCSLVNRTWSLHCRSVLRDHKKCVARIAGHRPCYTMKLLNNCLGNSSDVPFNGLAVMLPELSYNHHCVKCRGDLLQSYTNVLTKIGIRYFRIYWGEDWRCPAVRLIRKILLDGAEQLLGFDVMRLPRSISAFFVNREGKWFSNLKTLGIPSEEDPQLEREVLEKLISEPKKLEEIYGIISVKQLPFLFSRNSAKAVKDFMLHPKAEHADLCYNFAAQGPSLRKLFVSSYRFVQGQSVEFFSRILKLLLLTSADSLEKLDMEHIDLILLSHLGINPLKRLRYLTFGFCSSLDESEGYLTLEKIDYRHWFPNLRSVEIHADFLGEQDTAGFITEGFRRSTAAFACETVSILRLPQMFYHIDPESFQTFGQIFPNVQEFYTSQCELMGPFLKKLWSTWEGIELISFEMTQDRYVEDNFDDIFLGISLEEAEMLGASFKNEELAEYQFAPSQPSIRSLNNLKKLRLELCHQTNCNGNIVQDAGTVIASQLTGVLGFDRMPSLEVEISTEKCTNIEGLHCRFTLARLEPFVKFIDSRFWT